MSRRIKSDNFKTMYPIKSEEQLKDCYEWLRFQIHKAKSNIKKYQAERNYMVFHIGVNTAFRAEDLLQLRVKDLITGYIHIKENKTGKLQRFPIQKHLYKDICDYIEKYNLTNNDYMFQGQTKKHTYDGTERDIIKAITKQYYLRVMKKLAKGVGIRFPLGIHSLRKTFGYHYYKKHKHLITLAKMLNHSDYNVTLRYIMWDTDEIEKVRNDFYIDY